MDLDELEVRWRNFRGFKDTGQIPIRPITILLGSNNGGKTSFLVPLLLLKQTYSSHDPFISLKTIGELVDAGSFEDIAFDHNTDTPITFDVTFHRHNDSNSKGPIKPLGKVAPGRLQLQFDSHQVAPFVRLKKYAVFDAYDRAMLNRQRLASGLYSLNGLKKMQLTSGEKMKQKHFDYLLRKNINSSLPMNFLFTDDPFSISIRDPRSANYSRELSYETGNYLKIVEHVKKAIVELISSIDFIGPLRQRPARLYVRSGDLPDSVGPEGENTAELLYQWGMSTDRFIPAVEDWLRRFDFDVEIKIRALNKDAFSIGFKPKGSDCEINFADTGFGLSQVLPLIVPPPQPDSPGVLNSLQEVKSENVFLLLLSNFGVRHWLRKRTGFDTGRCREDVVQDPC